jgi:fibronectin-binding autotransporter adhesin
MMLRKKSILKRVALAALVALSSSSSLSAAVRVWTGNGTTNNWSEAANWQGNILPATNDDLSFPGGVFDVVTNNNLPTTLVFRSLSMASGNYVINGNPLKLSGNIVSLGTGANHTVNVGVLLVGTVPLTINVGTDAHLSLMKNIAGNKAITKNGPGRLFLAGNNGFTGILTINIGAVQIANSNALGSATGRTNVMSGAALELVEFIPLGGEFPVNLTIAEPLSIFGGGIQNTGALRSMGGRHVWNGNITLGGGIGNAIGVDAEAGPFTPDQLTINGVIEDIASGGFRKVGGGRLLLAGNNTYRETTNIDAGVVRMLNSNALGATTGLTRVAHNAALEIASVIIGPEEIPVNSSEPLQLFGGGVQGTGVVRNLFGFNSFSGPIQLMATSTIAVDRSIDQLLISSVISGTGMGLVKKQLGELKLSNNNTYTGRTTIQGGTLTVNGSQTASPITVTSGVLQGIGSVGAVSLAVGGTISPGGNALGSMTINGGLSTRGGRFRVDIGERLRVIGSVSLSSLVVSVFGPTTTTVPLIIENDGTDAVVGNMNGVVITGASGQSFKINTLGGTGNDVVLGRNP